MRTRRKADTARLAAIAVIICGIIFFCLNFFFPKLIPSYLRVGSLRRPTILLIAGIDMNYDFGTGRPLPRSDGRTDSILLARFDPVRNQLSLLSIPRDSFVLIPGYGMQKINAANVYGGIELTEQTIAGLTGLKIDNYMEINPYSLTKLVDIIGGINIYVEKDMYYVDRAANLFINLKQGWRKLNGREAEGYIRFRHDAEGDIGRIRRQQQFMQALFGSLARPSNLLKAPLALKLSMQYFKTNLPMTKMARLLNYLRMLPAGNIRTFTVAGDAGSSEYAGSIWVINRLELQKVIRDYFSR